MILPPIGIMSINEKYLLTVKEAAEYFNIGIKKMRRLAEDNIGRFAVYSGNRYLIIRPKFEQFLNFFDYFMKYAAIFSVRSAKYITAKLRYC